jgi:hypothetical protein
LAVEVPAIAKAALGQRGFAEAGVLTHWPEIVGQQLAAVSSPAKLSFPRGKRQDGTLSVRCNGGAALEVQHLTPQILDRINGYFGYRAITRLKIEQGHQRSRPAPSYLPPLTLPEVARISSQLEAIPDPELKDRLQRLGTAIRQREKQRQG